MPGTATNFRIGRSAAGAPTLFTPERREVIIASIRAGNYGQQAAAAARISPSGLRGWLQKGEAAALKLEDGEEIAEDQVEYAQFFYDCMAADAEAEARHVKNVMDAGDNGNWIASMTYLERRHPERWKRRDAVEHTGAGGGPVKIEINNSAESLAQVVGVLLEAGFAPDGLAQAAEQAPKLAAPKAAE